MYLIDYTFNFFIERITYKIFIAYLRFALRVALRDALRAALEKRPCLLRAVLAKRPLELRLNLRVPAMLSYIWDCEIIV
jgi:hypothetical protein